MENSFWDGWPFETTRSLTVGIIPLDATLVGDRSDVLKLYRERGWSTEGAYTYLWITDTEAFYEVYGSNGTHYEDSATLLAIEKPSKIEENVYELVG